MKIVRLWRFQAPWMVLESGVVDDVAKAFQSYLSFSDVLVAVNARIQLGLRIVKVKSQDFFGANQSINSADRFIPDLPLANIVPGRKKVRSVKTNSKALRRF